MNSPFKKRHFSPVMGCIQTSGCVVFTGSFLTRPPIKRVCAIILDDEWMASSLSRNERKVGERRLQVGR